MSNPLNIQISDEVLNNIITKNPFYINITGSVNICLVRCGQEIEKCNDVNFSTMTNYGKVLVLNPNKNDKSKCNIKLAFDSSNDGIDEDGMANYVFEKAFFTVPSLHRLNGQIYDIETFLLFSSIQKNGNILYVCLCALGQGTTNVKNNDWKLLNYKLMNELFIKNNKVPDIYGTTSISGVPNPIDLNNFIPIEGLRNFYDYTHPNNTNVNIRVFQTPMAVPNEVISLLKSKLTPGSTYESFKNAIVKSINPSENLYFYFSQDLTDNYKSYAVNNNTEKIRDTQETINTEETKSTQEIINNEETKNTEETKILNKLDTNDDNNSILDEENNKEENKENYQNDNSIDNIGLTYMIIIIIMLFFVSYIINYYLINFFGKGTPISELNLHESFSVEITDNIMSDILSNRFKISTNLWLQLVIIFIIIMISLAYMLNLVNRDNNYVALIFMICIYVITLIFNAYYNLKYIVSKFYKINDNNITEKENYYYNQLFYKIFNSNNYYNIFSYILKSLTPFKMDFSNLVYSSVNVMSGGFQTNAGIVPGLNNLNNKKSIQEETLENSIKNYNGITNFMDFLTNNSNYIFSKLYLIKPSIYAIFGVITIFTIIFFILFGIYNKNMINSFNIIIYILLIIVLIVPIILFNYYTLFINISNNLYKGLYIGFIGILIILTPILLLLKINRDALISGYVFMSILILMIIVTLLNYLRKIYFHKNDSSEKLVNDIISEIKLDTIINPDTKKFVQELLEKYQSNKSYMDILIQTLIKLKDEKTITNDFVKILKDTIDNGNFESKELSKKINDLNKVINDFSTKYISNQDKLIDTAYLLKLLKNELSKTPETNASKKEMYEELIKKINNMGTQLVNKNDFIQLLKNYIASLYSP